jgi:hypothetical protein
VEFRKDRVVLTLIEVPFSKIEPYFYYKSQGKLAANLSSSKDKKKTPKLAKKSKSGTDSANTSRFFVLFLF